MCGYSIIFVCISFMCVCTYVYTNVYISYTYINTSVLIYDRYLICVYTCLYL